MTNRTIKHEVKLQKSVIVILAVLAIGVCANAFAPVFSIKEAMAQFPSRLSVSLSGGFYCFGGCN